MPDAINDKHLQRFWERAIVQDGCWGWTGEILSGYAILWNPDRVTRRAHRISWMIHFGPIPAGLDIDHTCHNGTGCVGGARCPHRRCTNPAHLEAVSHVENISRGNINQYAAATHCIRGHEFTGENTYRHPRGKRVCRACRRS